MNIIVFSIVVGLLAAASWQDIKKRELPNTYAGAILLVGLAQWIPDPSGSLGKFILALIFAGSLYGFGYIMHKAKFWGGADVRLLAAMGAVLVIDSFAYMLWWFACCYFYILMFSYWKRDFELKSIKEYKLPLVPVFLASFIFFAIVQIM